MHHDTFAPRRHHDPAWRHIDDICLDRLKKADGIILAYNSHFFLPSLIAVINVT